MLKKIFNSKNKYKIIFFIILFLITCFVRLYNINLTARFTRDESSDLVSMKRIFDNHQITLVGPRADGDIAIFSSLTYYISMPFAVLFKFDPIGPAIATSFFGILTVILIWFLFKKNKINWPFIFLLPIFIFPFVEASRWAWNPHFIPFWEILGLLVLYLNIPFSYVISGLIFGLTIHQHWYAVFSCIGIGLLFLIQSKKLYKLIQYGIGLFLAIIPFIIFDITRPPGLFITRMIYFSPIATTHSSINIISILSNFIKLNLQFSSYLVYDNLIIGSIILALSLFLLAFTFLKKKFSSNLFLIPIAFNFLGLSLISRTIPNRYLLSSVLFYIIWLSQNIKYKISKIIVIIILCTNILYLPKILTQNNTFTNMTAMREITKIISTESKKDNLSFNLAVLQSNDGDTKGRRFRDLLSIQNVYPTTQDDYDSPKILYIISQKPWEILKNDQAYEMGHYRPKEEPISWKINNSNWIIYKIDRQK